MQSETQSLIPIAKTLRKKQTDTDKKRDDWLRRKGFRVLRFWNNDIIQKRQSVLDYIFQACDERSPSP
jgi:very-short-patch-repair endonuclease